MADNNQNAKDVLGEGREQKYLTTKIRNEGKQNYDLVMIEERISKVNGEISTRRYTKGKLLGKGGFAKCYEITNLETKRLLAAKIIPKTTLNKPRAKQKLISEIKIHRSLKNTNIVQFEHVFEDSDNVYILLELCPNQVPHSNKKDTE